MNLKKGFYFLFFIIFNQQIGGQDLFGTITDNNNIPVPNASILIKVNKNPENIIQYAFSDYKGNYKFIFSEIPKDSILLVVKSLSFEPERFVLGKITNKILPYRLDFKLQPRVTQLKEVIISTEKRPITVKKDTIVYNPNKFKDGTEKVVEDLLKKLPGIEVEPDGVIKYNGKSISKLLLEGDDLFGFEYTIGSKNIDVDVIEEVEAIEHYIENSLLRNIKDSDKVAINLKIKKGSTDLSGNISLGFGYENRYNIKNTALTVSKKIKGFTTLQYNNIGENPSPFNFTSNNVSLEALEEKDLLSKRIIDEGVFRGVNKNSQNLINNNYYASLNSIFNISKKSSLKVNLGYYQDKISQTGNRDTEYILNTENLLINETSDLSKRPILFNLGIEYEHDLSSSLKIVYKAKTKYQNVKTSNNYFNNGTEGISNLLKRDFFSLNQFAITKKINENNVFQFNGLLSYFDTPLNYVLMPGFDFDAGTIEENVTNKQEVFFEKTSFDSRITWLNNNIFGKLEVIAGINYFDNNLKSTLYNKTDFNLFNSISEDYENDLEYNIFKGYIETNFSYPIGKWSFKPKFNLNYFSTKFKNIIQNSDNELMNIIINPSIRINYKTGKLSGIYASYGYRSEAPQETKLFDGYILTSFRGVKKNSFELSFLDQHNFSLGYLKNDLFNLFRLNVFAGLTINKNDYSSNTLITNDLVYTNSFLLNRGNKNLYSNISVSKYLHFFRTTFSFRSNYSINYYNNIINNSILRLNKSNTLNSTLFFKTGFKKKLNFENRITLYNNSFYSDDKLISKASFFEDKFKLIYKFSDNFILTTTSNYSSPNEFSREYYFLDTEFSLTTNKKVSYRLTGKNLTNNTRIESFSISDYSNSLDSYSLLGFYMLVSANFKF